VRLFRHRKLVEEVLLDGAQSGQLGRCWNDCRTRAASCVGRRKALTSRCVKIEFSLEIFEIQCKSEYVGIRQRGDDRCSSGCGGGGAPAPARKLRLETPFWYSLSKMSTIITFPVIVRLRRLIASIGVRLAVSTGFSVRMSGHRCISILSDAPEDSSVTTPGLISSQRFYKTLSENRSKTQ
jgi:hypothetical protein